LSFTFAPFKGDSTSLEHPFGDGGNVVCKPPVQKTNPRGLLVVLCALILLIATKSLEHVKPNFVTFNAKKSPIVMEDMHLKASSPYYPSNTAFRK
jgi:hypothetical protein